MIHIGLPERKRVALISPSAALGAQQLSASAYVALAASTSLVTMPWWREWLRNVSEICGDAAPIVGVLIGLVTLLHVARGGDAEKLKNAKSANVAKVADAMGTAAKRGGASAAMLLGVVAVMSALFFLFLPRKDAVAAPIPPAAASIKGRKRAKDDAGEDGTDTAPTSPDGPAWYRELLALVGEHEGTARKPNPVVQKLFVDAGFPQIRNTAATAWCAAAINASLERHGTAGTKSLAARSFEKWGDKLETPRLGCVVVLWRGSPKSWEGHVGLFVRRDSTHVYVLGGNQSDTVSVAKFPIGRLLSYRWPRPLAATKTVTGAGVAAAGGLATAAVQIVEATKAIEPIQEPLAKVGTSGAAIAAWIGLAVALVTVAGAIWAVYGRVDVRAKTGA